MVGERVASFAPLQHGFTLLLGWIPEEQSGAVQPHSGSHIPPEFGGAAIWFKLWSFGTQRLCKDILQLTVRATDNGGLYIESETAAGRN